MFVRSRYQLLTGFVAATLLLGCDDPDVSNRDLGYLVGGIAGASIGNSVANDRTLGTVVGALAGSYIGGNIGKSIDKKNQERVAWVLENKPSNEAVAWQDPDKRSSYEVIPEPSYRKGSKICRPFTLTIYDGSRKQVQHGTACRVAGKKWVVED
tara:strand:- start:303 stop:764 length:462 start_codon:yes stop_codon:yes gene_type:complete